VRVLVLGVALFTAEDLQLERAGADEAQEELGACAQAVGLAAREVGEEGMGHAALAGRQTTTTLGKNPDAR
jgi:hypothetical protein